jgi:hypothetical protein
LQRLRAFPMDFLTCWARHRNAWDARWNIRGWLAFFALPITRSRTKLIIRIGWFKTLATKSTRTLTQIGALLCPQLSPTDSATGRTLTKIPCPFSRPTCKWLLTDTTDAYLIRRGRINPSWHLSWGVRPRQGQLHWTIRPHSSRCRNRFHTEPPHRGMVGLSGSQRVSTETCEPWPQLPNKIQSNRIMSILH